MDCQATSLFMALQVLKEKAVDPMQALVPCHALPGQNNNMCTV